MTSVSQEEQEDSAGELYLHVFAPVLVSYVSWVLRQAVLSGKKRLYFLARDGYQMYLAACHLCEKWNLDIDCRYLYVSRYAVRTAEYFLLQEDCVERICIGGIDVTFEKIMKRAALTETEAREIAELTGYQDRYDQVINYNEIMTLRRQLRSQQRFLEYVYSHSKDVCPTTLGYFEQEGMLENVPYALVDSGWVGTLQQSIQNLLRIKNPEIKIEGYYFGIYEVPKGGCGESYHSYYFTPQRGLRRKVYFSNSLFEAVFSAPSGMTVGYRQGKEGYEPVFDVREGQNRTLLEANSRRLNAYVEAYAEIISKQEWEAITEADQELLIESLLKYCMGTPSEYELHAYGGALFSDDVLEDGATLVAAKLSEQEIRNQRLVNKLFIMLGWKKATIHESAWIEGSIVRNGGNVKRNLRHAAWYKYMIYIRKMLKKKS